jgi:ubiquinone/menaquinone biosynthesis C-methylase UbiE
MTHEHVCPWWIGYFLASPVRRLVQKPESIVGSFVKKDMCVLEIGPGMGFFTLPMARIVGPSGKVVAVDIQERMLRGLRKRAARAGLADGIDCRPATPDSLRVEDLRGSVDFALALAVVHEVSDKRRMFEEIHAAMKPGGKVLVADPRAHFSRGAFDNALSLAEAAGFVRSAGPKVWRSWSAVLTKLTRRAMKMPP